MTDKAAGMAAVAVRPAYRVPLLLAAGLTMVAAVWGGLVRIGWAFLLPVPVASSAHGPLMISGFLGTLISLERAVGTGKRWVYLAPLMAALFSALTLAGTFSLAAGALPGVAAALVLCAAYASVLRHDRSRHLWVMTLGAFCWLSGNAFYAAGWPVFRTVHWWSAFLVLTIVGERLELNRFLRPSRWTWPLLVGALGIVVCGLLLGTGNPDIGDRILGAGYAGLAAWLVHYDIVRHTVKTEGLPRFVAVCLLAGFFWLAVSGISLAVHGPLTAGPLYDAVLHSLFLGFVFSMIFGHAPIIFPAILELPVRFRKSAYIPLVLLNGSLLVRITGDWTGNSVTRLYGALAGAVAIALYFAITLSSLQPSAER